MRLKVERGDFSFSSGLKVVIVEDSHHTSGTHQNRATSYNGVVNRQLVVSYNDGIKNMDGK